jgi:hypothetical protein
MTPHPYGGRGGPPAVIPEYEEHRWQQTRRS